MIEGLSVLGLIPARGGSKGLPGKNLREVADKPLIAWAIEAARGSAYIDRLIISSDDARIIETAVRYGCESPFVRPSELAQDDTPGIDPVLHAIAAVPGFDVIVLLQPTSPLRTSADIDGCVARMVAENAPACVTVTEANKSPWWMYRLTEDHHMAPLLSEMAETPRQQLPRTVQLNGAVYAARCDWLADHGGFLGAETVAYEMPPERSVDIDHELDLRIADLLLRSRQSPGSSA